MIEVTSTSIRDALPLAEGWEWRKIKDLKDFIKGGKSLPTDLQEHNGKGIPWFKSEEIRGDKFLEGTAQTITMKLPPKAKVSGPHIFEPGTLFVMRVSENPGRASIISEKAAANNQIIGVHFDRERVQVDYVYWWFKTRLVREHLRAVVSPRGVLQKNLRQEDVEDLDIPIPYPDKPSHSLEIQERLMRRIDALMKDIKESKRLLEEMTQDTMQILDFALRENFSDSTTKDWERKQIEEIATEYTASYDLEKDTNYASLPYVSGRNIENARCRLIQNPPPANPDLTGKQKHFLPNMVLYQTRDIQLRKVVHVDFEGLHSKNICALQVRPGIELDPRFLMWSLIAPPFRAYAETRAKNESQSSESTDQRPKLATKYLRAYEFRFPDKNSQISIVSRLNDVRESVTEMETILDTEKAALEQLEQSILERAFQGKL